MPRKLQLERHHQPAELKERYRSTSEPVEARRWHLIWLVSTSYTLTDAAAAVGLNYDYAREVVKSYNAKSAAGLRNRRSDRRPNCCRSMLTLEQQGQLKERLKKPPEDGGLWNGPKVARVIAEMTGRKKVWPQRGWDDLKRVDYSHQVPRPQHVKGDPEAQQAFKKNSQSAKHS